MLDDVDATQYVPDPLVGVAAFATNGRANVIPPINVMTPNSFESVLKFLMIENPFLLSDCSQTALHRCNCCNPLHSSSVLTIQNYGRVAFQYRLDLGRPNDAHVEEVPGKTPAVPFGSVQTTRLGTA